MYVCCLTSINTHNIKLYGQEKNIKCNFESKRWLERRTGTTTLITNHDELMQNSWKKRQESFVNYLKQN